MFIILYNLFSVVSCCNYFFVFSIYSRIKLFVVFGYFPHNRLCIYAIFSHKTFLFLFVGGPNEMSVTVLANLRKNSTTS